MTQAPSTAITSHRHLHEKMEGLDAVLQNHAIDDHHIVRSSIHFDPVRSLRCGDIETTQDLVATCTPEEFYAYEDAGMATGAYLAAQSIRYRVTGDDAAREAANQAFRGIKFIYHLGATKQEGFYPKPYGARYSKHISRDQYLYTLAGLAEYLKIANREHRAIIHRMARHMGEYWQSIDYSPAYFNMPSSSHLRDYMGSLFLGIAGITASITQDPQRETEFNRLFHDERLGERMPETLTTHFREGLMYDGAMYYRQAENPIMMKAIAIDHLWDQRSEHRALWAESLHAFWKEDLLVPLDRRSGMAYFIKRYDPHTHTACITAPGVINELNNPLKLSVLTYGGERKSAGSTQVAFAAAIIASRIGLPDASRVVLEVLEKLSLSKFRALTVPDATHVPPGHDFECDLLNTGHVAYWLWTYWIARERGLIETSDEAA